MAFRRGGEDKFLIVAIAAVVVFGVVSIGIGGSDNEEALSATSIDSQDEVSMASTEPTLTAEERSRGMLVTREEYGEQWPFTSDEGRIECRNGGALVFVVRDFEYQLNGLAEQMGYTKINSIWRWNPDIPGARIPLTPIIQRAKSLC